jgi:hypothetical protein
MTHSEFNHILTSINALSPDQIRRLLHELESRMAEPGKPPAQAPTAPGRDAEETAFDVATLGGIKGESVAPAELTEEELANQELQRRLFDAGLLSEIKPPIRDLTPYRNRQAVPIKGEPLSETVIRERR